MSKIKDICIDKSINKYKIDGTNKIVEVREIRERVRNSTRKKEVYRERNKEMKKEVYREGKKDV